MDNKQNRDALLHEILRETASPQRPTKTEPKEKDAATPPTTAAPLSQPAKLRQPAPLHNAGSTSSQALRRANDLDGASQKPVNAPKAAPGQTPRSAPATSPKSVPKVAPKVAEATDLRTAQWERTYTPPEPEEPPTYTEHVTLSQTGHLRVDEDLEGDSQPEMPPAEESHPTRSKRSGKRRKKHRVLSALIMTFIIIAVSVILSGMIIVYGRDLLGISSDSTTKIVTIPNGASMEEIAEILAEEGIISQPDFFVFIAGMSDKDTEIRPGDHELRPDMAYETILSELVSDPLDEAFSVTITFQEGIRLVDAAAMLEENNVCSADEFMDYFNSNTTFGYAFEEYLPSFQDEKFYRMEGYLFPDTYTFYQEMDVELVVQKILSNFNSKIDPAYYDRIEALDLNLDEIITLASMIQAEAGSVEEMADISSVFWNRMNNATEYPLLQSDPTTNYVEEVIKPHSETYNQTLYDAYDTYTSPGLPPGPICNPGSDAIYAALYPSNTDYYYFYANLDTGITYFARTLEEHEANQEMVAAMQASEAATSSGREEDDEDGETTASE